jgi:hypothetical protein
MHPSRRRVRRLADGPPCLGRECDAQGLPRRGARSVVTISPFANAALFALFAAVLLILSATSTRRFLFACGFVLPLTTPHLIVGVNLFWFNIIGFVALATLPLAPGTARRWNISRAFLIFIAYVTILTAVWMVAEYGSLERYRLARHIGLGEAQTIYKMPVQLVSFLMQCFTLYVIPSRAASSEDVYAAFRGYVGGLITSVLVGFVLLLTTGSGVIDERGAATFRAGGALLTRLGGLSGEPKTLGAFLVVGLGLLVAHGIGARRKKGSFVKRPSLIAAVLTTALFFTYSTSAWLAFAVVIATLFVVQEGMRRRLVVVAFILLAIGVTIQTPFLKNVIEQRVTQRVFEKDTQEVEGSKDNYVLDVYLEKPHFSLVGFGLGGMDLEATPFLLKDRKYKLQLQYVRTPTPSTTGARLIGDIGLAGMVLLAACVWTWRRRLKRRGFGALSVFVVATGLGMMFQSFNSISAFLFLCGGGLALERLDPAAAKVSSLRVAAPGDAFAVDTS